MNLEQLFSAKYWVMHDASTDDVFTATLDKTHENSVEKFFVNDSQGDSLAANLYMIAHPENDGYHKDDVYEWAMEHPTIKCSLVEINLKTMA